MLIQKHLFSLITNRFLELIILPTEQCNFRCTYCYEDFTIGKMQPQTIDAIKNLLTQRLPELDTLKISWFGGEPLLAKKVIYNISTHIAEILKQYPQINYYAGMTTNGYHLTNEELKKLTGLTIKTFQVSLDGTEHYHNQTRLLANGRSSFRDIWANLIAARDSDLDFSIMLRIHVTPENVLDLYELTENIKSSFGNDPRFTIFFKAIENLGGAKAGSFKTLYGKSKIEIINKLQELIGRSLAVKTFNTETPYVCYAAQPNSLLIRANGKLGKCTVAFDDDRNNIGELLPDGTIQITPEKLNLWTRGIKSQNLNELQCPLYNMNKL